MNSQFRKALEVRRHYSCALPYCIEDSVQTLLDFIYQTGTGLYQAAKGLVFTLLTLLALPYLLLANLAVKLYRSTYNWCFPFFSWVEMRRVEQDAKRSIMELRNTHPEHANTLRNRLFWPESTNATFYLMGCLMKDYQTRILDILGPVDGMYLAFTDVDLLPDSVVGLNDSGCVQQVYISDYDPVTRTCRVVHNQSVVTEESWRVPVYYLFVNNEGRATALRFSEDELLKIRVQDGK